jgi:uncharacterized protein YbcC (UPF0753/DUF2309 family)
MIVKLSGKSIEVHYNLSMPEGDRGRIGICERAEQILGWKAKVDFNIGLENMFRWIQQKIKLKSENQNHTCEKTDLSRQLNILISDNPQLYFKKAQTGG